MCFLSVCRQNTFDAFDMQIWFSHIFLARMYLLCAPSIHLSTCTNWLTLCLKYASSEYLYSKHCMRKRNYRQTDRYSLPSVFISLNRWRSYKSVGNMIFASCLSLKTIDKSILLQFTRWHFPAFQISLYHSLPLSSFFPIWQNLILQNVSSACNCQKSTEIRNFCWNSWKLNKHFGNILVCFVFNKQLLHSTAQFELKTIKLFLQSTFSACDLWKSCKNIDLHIERWRGVI